MDDEDEKIIYIFFQESFNFCSSDSFNKNKSLIRFMEIKFNKVFFFGRKIKLYFFFLLSIDNKKKLCFFFWLGKEIDSGGET